MLTPEDLKNPKPVIVMTVGGYDPLHIGHISHFKEAKKLGDVLIVVVQSDKWLVRKKGKYLISLSDRMEIIRNLEPVDYVIGWHDDTISCHRIIEALRPNVFAKGGDRTKDNLPKEEIETCKRLGVEIAYNVGARKIRSSSELLSNYHNNDK